MQSHSHDAWKWNTDEQRYEGNSGVTITMLGQGIWQVRIPMGISERGRHQSTGFETNSLEYAMREACDYSWIVRARA